MRQLDPERVQATFNQHDAEILLLRQLVNALLDAHPKRQKILERFQREAEGQAASAPPGTDLEYLVEVRARLQVYLAALNLPCQPIE